MRPATVLKRTLLIPTLMLTLAWWYRLGKSPRKVILIGVVESNTHGLAATPISDQLPSLLDSLALPSNESGLPTILLTNSHHAPVLVIHDVDFSGFRVQSQLTPVPRTGTKVDLSRPVIWPQVSGNVTTVVDNSCRLLTPSLVVERLDSSGTVSLMLDERRLKLHPGEWFGLACANSKSSSGSRSRTMIEVKPGEDWENRLRSAVAKGEMVSRITVLNYGWVELRDPK
ncbi:MAG: hypothetical protein ACPLPR_01840 [Bacillota bacterium]